MSEFSTYEQMVQKKQEIESELAELGRILVEEGNVGMNGNLVDKEGFPRADIDIYKVRNARQRINCLQNDYKVLISRIEKEIVSIHSLARSKELIENSGNGEPLSEHKPFLKITQVDADSPSFEAGLRVNDLIIQFGPFNSLNTRKNLSEIAEHVKEHANKIILVKVLRESEPQTNESEIGIPNGKKMTLKLTPKTWSGHGLLGCKLVYCE